ncbi:MAG: nucleotidyl transferase AbiEii/AbiGii toxin family protein [Patescibacteria group bacterium]
MHEEILTEEQVKLLPFKIDFSEKFEDIINIPDLLTLAAMKAYALNRRAKWKDYVDLYFIFKDHFSLGKVMNKAREIFQGEFNEKNFRSQLSYFKDIDHSEEVVYLKGFEINDKIIEKSLIEFSLQS